MASRPAARRRGLEPGDGRAGLWLRAYAAGYVKKNRELTVTGPYAHTRNPLYLGSMLIAADSVAPAQLAGSAGTRRRVCSDLYSVIVSEERFLRVAFPEFDDYCRRVPRLIPRLTPARPTGPEAAPGTFSVTLYCKHHEYNALGRGRTAVSLPAPVAAGSQRACPWAAMSSFRARIVHLFKEPCTTVKMRMQAATILCALVLAAVALGQQVAPLTPPHAGFSFPQRQTLIYSVDWRVFPAGTAVMHFEATGDRERLTANADTIGAINLIFHVGDRFQSTFDRVKGCTYEFDKQTVEGRRQISSTRKLDYAQSKSHFGRKEPGHRANQTP